MVDTNSALVTVETVQAELMQEPMTVAEAKEAVEVINRSLATARLKLLELYEREGWKALGYSNFRECAMAEFQVGQARVYQELKAAEVVRNISTNVETDQISTNVEIREAHLRPLTRLSPEEQQEVWAEVMAATVDGEKLTAKLVERVARFKLQATPAYLIGDVVQVVEDCPTAFLQGKRGMVTNVQIPLPGTQGTPTVWVQLEEHPLAPPVEVEPQYLRKLKPPRKERQTNDLYPTDKRLLEYLLRECPELDISGRVLEPCAGNGDLAQVFPGRCVTNDIDLQLVGEHDFDFCLDATKAENWIEFGDHDWVVTNPPFGSQVPILEHALEFAGAGVVMLLRLSFLERCADRVQLLRDWADSLRWVVPVNPRPEFRSEKGGDQVTVAWFVWDKEWSWRRQGMPCPFRWITGWR